MANIDLTLLDGYAIKNLAAALSKIPLRVGGVSGPGIVTSAGAPSGTPATGVGTLSIDVTNGKLYINTTGSTWVVVGAQT